jgi:hypothetical protein
MEQKLPNSLPKRTKALPFEAVSAMTSAFHNHIGVRLEKICHCTTHFGTNSQLATNARHLSIILCNGVAEQTRKKSKYRNAKIV